MRLLLATANPGKIKEFQHALAGLELDLIPASQWGPIEPPQETGDSFAANARLKAEYYFGHTGLPALADDSGLEVAALGGRPGVQSARYGPTSQARIEKLMAELKHVPGDDFRNRRARFVCALCLYQLDRQIEVEGKVSGVIIDTPRGSGGFGYDPVFYYPPLQKTFAELSRTEKNQVSHRARALARLRGELEKAIAGSS